MAPESVGLPADDQYNHLVMLRQYVQYGPSLGMSQPLVAMTPLGSAVVGGGLGGGGWQGPPEARTLERSGFSMSGTSGAASRLLV